MPAIDPCTASIRPAQAARRTRRLPSIDSRRCTGCGWCVAACDLQLLSLVAEGWDKRSVLHEAERCTGCSLCALRCPFEVITMRQCESASLPPGCS